MRRRASRNTREMLSHSISATAFAASQIASSNRVAAQLSVPGYGVSDVSPVFFSSVIGIPSIRFLFAFIDIAGH